MTAQLTLPHTIAPQTWTWRGHQIQYMVQGQGRPVVLIHGFGASMGHWRKNIPSLVQAGYRVFALDLLGFGGSDKPRLDYTLDLWQALLKDFAIDQVQDAAVFVGNSMGGLLTLMMLAHHPDVALGGVLLNAAGGLNLRPEELNLPQRWVMGGLKTLITAKRVGPFLFDQVRSKPRIRGSLAQVYGNPDAITDELVEMLYQPSCDPNAHHVFASIMTAPAGPRPADLLPQIQHPLLVLWGEEDPWAALPTAEIYRQLSQDPKVQPQVTFHPIPQTGHCPHDERPEVVNPLMIDWLEGDQFKPRQPEQT